MNILIVEDDILLSEGIKIALEVSDRNIFIARSIEDAKMKMEEKIYSLMLLDINLPDGNGLDLLQEIRETNAVPIILITANDMDEDIVKGFEYGADDYITKPFSLSVLRARVLNQLKRITLAEDVYEIGNLYFNFDAMEFKQGNKEIVFSKNEIKLLKLLLDHKNMILKRDVLIDKIWTESGNYVYENSLSVIVKRIRMKLGSNDVHLKTVYGLGYKWVE